MITLHIDTSQTKETVVALDIDGQKTEKKEISTDHSSQYVLKLLDQILNETHHSLHDINAISLHTGPGSFTGLKVGASIAGTLSLLLNIPINGEKPGVIPQIHYGKDKYGISE